MRVSTVLHDYNHWKLQTTALVVLVMDRPMLMPTMMISMVMLPPPPPVQAASAKVAEAVVVVVVVVVEQLLRREPSLISACGLANWMMPSNTLPNVCMRVYCAHLVAVPLCCERICMNTKRPSVQNAARYNAPMQDAML